MLEVGVFRVFGLLMDGIVLGSILALGAVSLTMVYGVLNFANLAHGDFIAFGAYGGIFANRWLGLGLLESIMLAVLLAILLGVFLEKTLWKPLRDKGAGLVTFLIVSMGVGIALRNSLIAGFGESYHFFDLPTQAHFEFWGVRLGEYEIAVVVVAVVSMFMLYFLLHQTKLGKSLRALSDSIDLARISGINVPNVIVGMWVIVMFLAVLAGVLYGVVTTVRPMMGFHLLLSVFAATILGGIGSVYGAVVGGLVLGISEEMSTAFLPSEYKLAVAFVVLIVVLIVRPKGIFRGLR